MQQLLVRNYVFCRFSMYHDTLQLNEPITKQLIFIAGGLFQLWAEKITPVSPVRPWEPFITDYARW